MTLKELATIANVSQSTVSKAFSYAKDVSAETREYIFKVAKEHHCYEKFHKGNYFKKIIAVICPEIKSEAYYSIVTHLETLFANMGFSMVLSISNFDPDTEKTLFYYHAHYQKVDGIIVIASRATYKDEDSIPMVRIATNPEISSNCIDTSYQDGVNEAVKHLIDMGHHKIGFIGEEKAHMKTERFYHAMTKWLLPIRKEYVIISEERFEAGGYYCMEKLLELKEPPTAVIAAYDYMALGALKCLNDHGLSVPDDMSLIGQDNISMVSYLNPPLTSIIIPYQEQCELAIRLLEKKMKNKSHTWVQEVPLHSTLVKRNSVKNLKRD